MPQAKPKVELYPDWRKNRLSLFIVCYFVLFVAVVGLEWFLRVDDPWRILERAPVVRVVRAHGAGWVARCGARALLFLHAELRCHPVGGLVAVAIPEVVHDVIAALNDR